MNISEVIRMRLAGLTWVAIGEIYHMNPTIIRKQVEKELFNERIT